MAATRFARVKATAPTAPTVPALTGDPAVCNEGVPAAVAVVTPVSTGGTALELTYSVPAGTNGC